MTRPKRTRWDLGEGRGGDDCLNQCGVQEGSVCDFEGWWQVWWWLWLQTQCLGGRGGEGGQDSRTVMKQEVLTI